jgi:aminoglycoside 6'-N-acetyltransferase
MMTEESFIDFKCPHCGDTISFPRDSAGMVQECPICSETVIVPDDGSGLGRRLPIPITTEKLVLRRLAGGDWKDLLECLSDEELFRYAEGRPLSEEEIIHWLDSDRHVKLTTPGQAFVLGIAVPDTGKLIGYLSLGLTGQQHLQAALDVTLGRSHQRKGFATEAVAATLHFCFEGIGLHRVSAHCDSRNVAARRLCEKAGMRREGEFVEDRLVNGEWTNTVWYAALSAEYREAHGKPADTACL